MKIILQTVGEYAEVRPGEFLGNAFPAYLRVVKTHAIRYDGNRRLHILPAIDVPMLKTDLESNGFTLEESTRTPIVLRPAKDDEERNAAAGIIQVAGMDPDFARNRNGVGFSGVDSEFGHKMAEQASKGLATDKQWMYIVKLAKKYRKQIGG